MNIPSRGRIAIAPAFLALTCIVFLMQCRDQNKHEDPYADVKVDVSLAKDPPIATHVDVSLLPKETADGNFLFEATMPKEKIKRDVLALFLGDSTKLVLHDDGKNGDQTAGDGIFSTVMRVNIDSLGIFVKERIAAGRRLLDSKEQLFEFNGRLEVPVNRDELEKTFSAENLKLPPSQLFARKISFLPIRFLPHLLPVSSNFKEKALLVTDPSVIEDPARTFDPCTNTGTAGGAWTFGKLMKEMANQSSTGVTPEDLTLQWLNSWKTDQTVNTDLIPKRTLISNIISTWQTLSGGPGHPLDVNKAPFKLLAIVNRFDLHTGGGAYGGGNAGEGRFVFVATTSNCQPPPAPHFLVIFEYGVNKGGCAAIHSYAQQWANLAPISFGASYNAALQAITDQFTLAGTNPSKPNGNSLDQLRTNELQLGLSQGLKWELREFHIDPTSHLLFNVTVKREPKIPFNSQGGSPNTADVDAFGKFVNDNAATIIADNMDLPDNITAGGSSTAFQAGHSLTPDPTFFHWDAATTGTGHITSDEARMHISLNTCSGCHGGETNNGNFTNIDLLNGGIHLSPFLTGHVQSGSTPSYVSTPFFVADRANRPSATSPTNWPFNDVERRGRILQDFITSICFPRIIINEQVFVPPFAPIELANKITFKPLTMTD